MKKTRFTLPEKRKDSMTLDTDKRKREYLINKFNLTKETIKVEDIKDLIEKLNATNVHYIKTESAQFIFNILDKKKRVQ